jgi:hypothetical protein
LFSTEKGIEVEDLDKIYEAVRIRSHIDQTFQIGANTPFVVDYRQRKHIFIWSPTSISISVEDYGTGTIPAQQWINIGIKEGTQILAPAFTTSTTPLMVRWTDEVIA